MGREVKRVALDFKWFEEHPKEIWEGYVNPHYRQCETCKGSGATAASEWLESIVHLLLMVGNAAVSDGPLHPWLRELPLAPNREPSREFAVLTEALAGRSPDRIFGHDGLDKWRAKAKIIEAAGLDPESWGVCKVCDGHGDDPAHREASEAWEPTEPPAGEGWQMWETTTEGSPMSPVFERPEDLAEWLADTGASSFGSDTATYSQWLSMIRAEWTPSAFLGPNGFESGVAATARENNS